MGNKGIRFALLTAFISGLSIFLNKFGVAGINASVFTTGKNILTAFLLFGTIALAGKWNHLVGLKRKDLLKLAVIGLFGGSIPFLLFFNGLKLTSAVEAAFIHKTMFLWAGLLAWVFLKERIDKRFIIGAGLILIGNIMVLKGTPLLSQGNLMILAATILWALENVISKHALGNLDPELVGAGRMGFGSMFLLLFLLATGEISFFFQLNPTQLGWIALTSSLLFLYVYSWYQGLQSLPVSVATCILLLGSPITSLLSLAVSQVPSISESTSILLTLFGVMMIIGLEELKAYGSARPSSSA